MNKFLSLALVALLFSACNTESKQHPMVGLWQISTVTIEGEENTPDDKWMRFNADSTQESGNGWLQHSIGKWKLDGETKELLLHQENGWKDAFENFKVTFTDAGMTWSRMEDGQAVVVNMKKINKIPKRQADELYGIWKLHSTKIDDIEMKTVENTTIFFRWDKMFIAQDESNRSYGMFKAAGHEDKLELVYYNGECTREYWNFSVKNNILKLEAENSEQKTIQTYERIYELN
jgi:hypothetical protein